MRRRTSHARHGIVALLALLVWASCNQVALGQSPPDPGGDEFANVSLPPAGKEFGFNDLFNVEGVSTAPLADLVAGAGGNAARMPLDWWGLERVRDVWDPVVWARHKLAYDTLLARGIKPHFILANAPPWARDPGSPTTCVVRATCQYPPAPSMMGEWRQVAGEVARRFPLATVEIWNEPNLLGQWRTGVDPQRYASLLAAAYEAIKAQNPSQQVLMGGMAEVAGSGSMKMPDFLDAAYGANPSLKGHTDAINMHVYPAGNLKAGSPFAQQFAWVREIKARYGDSATGLFVSETGQTTSGSLAVSEAQQADRIVRAVRKILTMPDVRGVLVHSLLDRPSLPETDIERGYGLVRIDLGGLFTPKRAMCELVRMAANAPIGCPPLARIQSGPSGWHTQSSAVFGVASSEPATLRCSIDDGPQLPCGSLASYPSLAEGAHTFSVQAFDALGRSDPEPIEREFTVDTGAPDTSLWGPSGDISDKNPRFAPSSPDPDARLECSLNGAAFAPCGSSVQLGPLADGKYELRARAVDPAGNVDADPAIRSIRVDTRAPLTAITSGPSGRTAQDLPRFEFVSDEPGTRHLCAFNRKPLGACRADSAHWTAGALSDGAYSFEVISIDEAGNRGPVVLREFEVDTTGPSMQISAPVSPTRDSTPTFTFSSPETGARFECRFDAAAFAPCDPQSTAAMLADGHHSVEARAVDSLGNRGQMTRLVFVVDTRVPQVAFTSGPPASSNLAEVVFGFQADEARSRFECSLDTAPFAPCQSPLSVGALGDGSHALKVRATDEAGNVGPVASRAFAIDRTGPTVTITSGTTGSTREALPTFRFSSEPGARFQCRFDSQSFAPCFAPSSHVPAAPLAEGPHVFEVRATDRLENLGALTSRSFAVDQSAPVVTSIVFAGAVGDVVGPTPNYTLTSNEGSVSFECRLDALLWTRCDEAGRLGPVGGGPHSLTVRATDPAGNVSAPTSAAFVVDASTPSVAATVRRIQARSATILLSSDDPGARFVVSVDGKRERKRPARCKVRDLKRGKHAVRAWAIDPFGNRSTAPASVRFRIR